MKKDVLEISEVCSHNETIIYNTIGEYVDYIELYNSNESDVNLKGLFLSDRRTDRFKYCVKEDLINVC